MDKDSKVSSSTKWRLRENVVLRPMEYLTPTVKVDIFISISNLPTYPRVHDIRATGMLSNANALSLGKNSRKKMEHGNFELRALRKKTL